MIVHGSANALTQIGKIAITTIAADQYGDNYADQLDSAMPDTALGVATYSIGLAAVSLTGDIGDHFAEKAGAVGDLLDLAVGLGITKACGKELAKQVAAFRNSSGQLISKSDLLKLNQFLIQNKQLQAAEVIQSVVENYDRAAGFISNALQLEGR